MGSLFSLLKLRLVHDVVGYEFTGVTFNNHLSNKLDFLDFHGCKELSFYNISSRVCQRLRMQEDDQIAYKRLGSIGGLSLETMEVAAEPTLQTDVLEKMDIDDVFLKDQKHGRKLEMAAVVSVDASWLWILFCA